MSSPFKPLSARLRLARNVRRLRQKIGFSQEELSAKAGFSQTYLSQIETGGVNVPIDRIEKLANALDIDLVDLLIL